MAIVLEFNDDLLWQSDWDGCEIGYDRVSIVGLYNLKDTDIYFYIDMETNKILEGWQMIDE